MTPSLCLTPIITSALAAPVSKVDNFLFFFSLNKPTSLFHLIKTRNFSVGGGVVGGVRVGNFTNEQLYLKTLHPPDIHLKLQILRISSRSQLGHPCQTCTGAKVCRHFGFSAYSFILHSTSPLCPYRNLPPCRWKLTFRA